MADRLLGSFAWTELMTTDPAAAESFYTKVVGWTTKPFGPDGSYTVLNNSSGAGRGGIMKIPDEAKGMPPNWMMYIGTPDVDAMAMRVAQLGGRIHKQPSDIPGVGRFAVVADPYGAFFNIFTPSNAGQDMGKAGTGDFSWFELYTPNPEGAWKFYEALFGWEKTSAMDMGDMGVYQMFGRGGGIPNGGIMKPPPGAAAAWMPYALVKDAKAAAATATANGGKIVNGPMEVPGGDWIAQGMDPQGAMFAVHSLNPAGRAAAPTSAKPSTSAKATAGKPASTAAKKAAPEKKAAKKPAAKKAAKKSSPKKAKAKAVKKSAKRAKPAKKAPKKKAAKKAAKKKAAKRKK